MGEKEGKGLTEASEYCSVLNHQATIDGLKSPPIGVHLYLYTKGSFRAALSGGDWCKKTEFPCLSFDTAVVRYHSDEEKPGDVVVQLLDKTGDSGRFNFIVESGKWRTFPISGFDKIRVYGRTADELEDSEDSEEEEDSDETSRDGDDEDSEEESSEEEEVEGEAPPAKKVKVEGVDEADK